LSRSGSSTGVRKFRIWPGLVPDVQARLSDLGVEVGGGPSEQLGEFQKAEIAKWAKVVKAAGVKPE